MVLQLWHKPNLGLYARLFNQANPEVYKSNNIAPNKKYFIQRRKLDSSKISINMHLMLVYNRLMVLLLADYTFENAI